METVQFVASHYICTDTHAARNSFVPIAAIRIRVVKYESDHKLFNADFLQHTDQTAPEVTLLHNYKYMKPTPGTKACSVMENMLITSSWLPSRIATAVVQCKALRWNWSQHFPNSTPQAPLLNPRRSAFCKRKISLNLFHRTSFPPSRQTQLHPASHTRTWNPPRKKHWYYSNKVVDENCSIGRCGTCTFARSSFWCNYSATRVGHRWPGITCVRLSSKHSVTRH
jgi:hypothetical protein